MKAEDIQLGETYRAKHPKKYWSLMTGHCFNDRVIIWISKDRMAVQYDGVTVKTGQQYPKVTMEKFLKWASHEVQENEIKTS